MFVLQLSQDSHVFQKFGRLHILVQSIHLKVIFIKIANVQLYTDLQVKINSWFENNLKITMPWQNNENILSDFWQFKSVEYRKTTSIDVLMYYIRKKMRLIWRVNVTVSFVDNVVKRHNQYIS